MRQIRTHDYDGLDRRNGRSWLAPWVAIGLTVLAGGAGYGALQADVTSIGREQERRRDLVDQVPVLVVEVRAVRADIARVDQLVRQLVQWQIDERHRTVRADE